MWTDTIWQYAVYFESFGPMSELPRGSRHCYCDFDELYSNPTNVENASDGYITGRRAEQIFRYLRVYYTFLLKKSGRKLDFFKEFDEWHEIRQVHKGSFI